MKPSQARSITKGSVADVAQETGRSLAEALMRVRVIVLIDQSDSMGMMDGAGGKMRFDRAEEELRRIQDAYPGQVAVVQFSDVPEFLPGGVPTRPAASTNMLAALKWVADAGADGLFTIVLISDGEPNSPRTFSAERAEQEVLELAATLKGPIHTIFIGPEGDLYGGRAFLERLAALTGGRKFVAPRPGELGPGVVALLAGETS